MKLNISVKNVDLTDELRSYAEKRLIKVGDLVKSEIPINIVLKQEDTRNSAHKFVTEVTIGMKRGIVRAEERAQTPEASIDLVREKILRQMRRIKTRVKKRRRENSILELELANQIEDEVPQITELDEVIDLPFGKVVKTKKYALDPLTVEDAAAQIDMLQHSFFIFRNRSTDSVQVVYRRRDGNYGLIDTV